MVHRSRYCHHQGVTSSAPQGSTDWSPDARHLDGLMAAVVATDVDGRIVYCNGAAEGLTGHRRDHLLGADAVTLLFPEQNHGAIREVAGQVLAGGHWAEELSMLTAGEVVRPLNLAITPVWRDGAVVGLLLIVEDPISGATGNRSVRRTSERLARLVRVTAELVMADDMETVTKVVISHAADAAGATVASLCRLVDDDTLALVGLRGGVEGAASRWATFSVHATTPAGDSVRTGESIVLSGRDAIRARYPDLESAAPGERSMVCVPLRIAGRATGAITLSFPGHRTFDTAELEFFGLLADTCGQAIARLEAIAHAADQAAKLTFLADASAELAGSLDYQATLKRVAQLAVPRFADWCSISLVDDDNLRTLEVAHVDPKKVEFAWQMQAKYPPDRDAPVGAWHVVRTGQSELIPEITDELLVASTRDAEHLRLARELNLRSALTVPLTARGKVLGAITWVSADEGRRFTPADLTFGEDLARRAAVAIDNSELHSEVRDASANLQRAVLPESLQQLPGWQFTGFYSPSGRTDVGGDFYDVIRLDGRVALFVGDVMGRGVTAAAAMAQMRSAIRAYAAVDPEPVSLVSKLDLMFDKFEVGQMVTLLYAVVDPATDSLEVVNAGHLPPLVVRADGTQEQLPFADGAPLGVDNVERTSRTVRFAPGDTCIVYTDGLIEQRAEHIDAGQARLAEAVAELGVEALAENLEHLVETVRDHSREDDIAVLVARRLPLTAG